MFDVCIINGRPFLLKPLSQEMLEDAINIIIASISEKMRELKEVDTADFEKR